MKTTVLGLVVLMLATSALVAELGQGGTSTVDLARNGLLAVVGLVLAVQGFVAVGAAKSEATRQASARSAADAAAKAAAAQVASAQAKAADLLAEAARRQAAAEGEREEMAAQLAARESKLATLEGRLAARASGDEAVALLSLLQQKGRLIDFLMEDVAKFSDAQIGAAARVVHQGCAGVVREYFDIKPLHDGSEGGALTLARDYDARRYRLVGSVHGEPPFAGRVLHRGWFTSNVKLPEATGPAAGNGRGIIAPAEVELS
jgi:hypothetical protein